MKPLKITAVSYLNTFPFVHGITKSGLLQDFELDLQIPSLCGKKLVSGETDIALVPVAAIHNHPEFEIYTDFCIGCNGRVKTVLLLSKVPVDKIENIYLDYDSTTSVNLIKVLCKFYWKINPLWIPMKNSIDQNEKYESIVAIGDKTFELEKKYPFSYDLGEMWRNFTGLPFVFACWAGKKGISKEMIKDLNAALSWGIYHIPESIETNPEKLFIPKDEAIKYLQSDINFILDKDKKDAMQLFYKYLDMLVESTQE